MSKIVFCDPNVQIIAPIGSHIIGSIGTAQNVDESPLKELTQTE